MRTYFIKYFFNELASYILLIPLVLTLLMITTLFGNNVEETSTAIFMVGLALVCSLYFDERHKQQTMTNLFPISKKTWLAIDCRFFAVIVTCYLLYCSLISITFSAMKQQIFIFPSIHFIFFTISYSLVLFCFYFVMYRTKIHSVSNLVPYIMIFILIVTDITSTFLSIYNFTLFVISIFCTICITIFTYFFEQRRFV